MKQYAKRQQPVTVYDVIKQRDTAREEARSLIRERDQLQMLCQIAAHYIRYLPLRPEDCDQDMIVRLEAAAKGDMDVSRRPQDRPVGAGASPASSGPAPRDAQPPSVQGDLQPAPAPDSSQGRPSPEDFALTAAQKKVVKALASSIPDASYDELSGRTGIPRHRIISAVHVLQHLGLAERKGLRWRLT